MGTVIAQDPKGKWVQFTADTHTVEADAIPVSAPAAGGLSAITVSLTANQISHSFSSPITIVPGVVGKTIAVLFAEVDYTFVTADYDIGGGNFNLNYEGFLSVSLGLGSGFNPSSGVDMVSQALINYPHIPSISNVKGLGVVFSADSDPISGDGTMKITVLYTLF